MIFRVKRFDPPVDRSPHWRIYNVDVRSGMKVLDGLLWIRAHVDDTLGLQYSCRAGTCGSCAMVINGRENLACRFGLDRTGHSVSIEPLRSLPVIKDLAVDMAPFFAKYDVVGPFYAATYCISCGACYSACPIVAVNPDFLGPAALNRAYERSTARHIQAGVQRLPRASVDGGIYACHNVGNCVTACPVGVNPLLSIQLLRKGSVHG